MKPHSLAKRVYAVGLVLAVSVLAACSGTSAPDGNASAPGASDGEKIQVGLLLPENQTVRFEQFDRPVFEAELAKECENCEVLYANAGFDASKQQSQIESMIAQGVDVLVLMAVDSKAIETSVKDAASRGIPVIAYERFIDGPVSYAVTREFSELGSGNGDALLAAITENGDLGGTIVAINGDPATADIDQIRDGWASVLEGQVEIGREFDTPGWDPSGAQTSMEQAISALGAENIVGVMAMNDGMAGGAIAALKAAGVNPLPPVTGMDAELAAVQRIVAGEQVASVYNDPITMATVAAQVAAKVAKGLEITPDSKRVNSAGVEVPIVKVPLPDAITIKNVKSNLIDTGVYTIEQICTPEYADACAAAGLQ